MHEIASLQAKPTAKRRTVWLLLSVPTPHA